MSRIYNHSTIFCPSSLPSQLTSITPNSIHHLSNLYFCPSCQSQKCVADCYYNIECKFCSNCLTDHSKAANDLNYCTKNCFECPQCMGVLRISVKDHVVLGRNGKGFSFLCDCGWLYDTRVVMTPKPLHEIIKEEQRERSDRECITSRLRFDSSPPLKPNPYFKKYRKNLEKKCNDMARNVPWKQTSSDETRLKNLELSNLARKDVADILSEPSTCSTSLKLYSSRPNFPILKKLTLKKSLKCIDCNTYLLLQSTAPGQLPTVNKFLVKFNAIDYMPSIKVSGVLSRLPSCATYKIGGQYNFLINIMNPLPFEIKVHLSTVPFIPKQFITSKNGQSNLKINLTLPESRFKIKPTPSKAPIKAIPTSFLTKDTLISRSELAMRLDRALFTDNDTENLASLVDLGNNWLQAPINLFIEQEEAEEVPGIFNIKIPLYITVNSQLPESIKKLNLNKKELSYGYWNVVDLGDFQFETGLRSTSPEMNTDHQT